MPSDTARGYEYPLAGDKMREIVDTVHDLADRIDAQLGRIERGVVNVTVTASTLGTVAVVFAQPFAAPPSVQVTIEHASFFGSSTSVTAAGFTANARLYTGTATTVVKAHWVAIG